MTKREPFLTIEEIREKCEQYWNERGVLDEELHSILSFIHVRASKLNAAFESAVAERVKEAVALAQYECGCAKCVNPPGVK